LHAIEDAIAVLESSCAPGPVTVVGNEAIRATLDPRCLQQALDCRAAPGVTEFVVNPDAHAGHGVPVGAVCNQGRRSGG
jgi:tRNA-splicing ligase RtcB